MNEKVMVRIDGEMIAASAGQSVLQVARANGKYIPSLCYMEGLSPQGSCRLCMIEVSGVKKLQPACTTPVAEGLSVTTRTAQLSGYRKMALELLFAERNHVCAVCVSSGHCELQSLAQEHGVTNVRFSYSFPDLTPDTYPPTLRLRPQPLRAVRPLRAHLRRDRGRPRVGHRRTRRGLRPGERAPATLG